MRALLERAQAVARKTQQLRLSQIAERLDEQLRGVDVRVGNAVILLSGRKLLSRWLSEPALRFLTGSGR